MHKDTWVFLSGSIMIPFPIHHLFLYTVRKLIISHPCAVFFISHQPTSCLHFCILCLLLSLLSLLFSLSFYNFSKAYLPLSLTHTLLHWKISAAAILFWSEWQEMLLIQCSKAMWYNESSGWFYSSCQNKGWP